MTPIRSRNALAEFAADLTWERIPESARAVVKRVVIDSVGTGLAATGLGAGCAEFVAIAERLGGPAESTILGSTRKVACAHAALANGALVHALNYDPIGGAVGHIGVAALASPLAAAEACRGTNGRDLLTAVAASCEVTARVTRAVTLVGRRPSERFLSGQMLSYHGAAAGAGNALGLDARQMRSAFGIASMQMAGSRQIVMAGDPPAKASYGAYPNQAGVLSALLAQAGLGADIDPWGAPAGLFSVIYEGDYDDSPLTVGLGDRFFLEEVEFKPWPTSNQVHASIEAALKARGRVDASEVKSVKVTVHSRLRPWCEPQEKRRRPDNAAAAADSIPYCVATALLKANVTLEAFRPEALQDRQVLEMADRIEIDFRDDVLGAVVALMDKEGERYSFVVLTPMGSRSCPLPDKQLDDKFFDCCNYSKSKITHARAQRLLGELYRLDDVEDLSKLTMLMS
jgi:2-methylcitrate dehydratase PrpD